MIYLICLDTTERDNPAARIDEWVRRSYDTHLQPLPGCWIVSGPLAAEQIHTALTPLLGDADRLLIVKAASEAIWQASTIRPPRGWSTISRAAFRSASPARPKGWRPSVPTLTVGSQPSGRSTSKTKWMCCGANT
jgi:hypothetical protein